MQFEKEKTNELTNIKNVIAVMSGKGGVGKSSVTSLIAVALRNKGYSVGILDADITGPSIPKMFGINGRRADTDSVRIYPVETATGIKVISVNLLIDKEDSPVIWRGPLIAKTVKQFYTDVVWGDLDYLVIDLPPGTGDVPLTIMQSLPIDGMIVVSSPQDVVKLIVKKSVNMANMMNSPILGIIENMSYLECPDCKKKIHLFGQSSIEEAVKEMNIDVIAKLPIDPQLAELCDEGRVELYENMNVDFETYFSNRIEKKLGGIRK